MKPFVKSFDNYIRLNESAGAVDFSASANSLKTEIRSSMQEKDRDPDEINRVIAYINVLVPIAENLYVSEFQSKVPPGSGSKGATPEQTEQVKRAFRSWIRKTVTAFAPSISKGDKRSLWWGWKFASWDTVKNLVTRVAWRIEGIVDGADESDASRWSSQFEKFIVDEQFIEEMYNILVD